MIRSRKRMRLCTALIALTLAFIWGNSLLPAELSQAFSDWVKDILLELFPAQGSASQGGGLLRKIAHFTEFAALGALVGWRLAMLGKRRLMGLLPCCAAACVDETIQAFVPGRAPGLADVCIDTSGAAAGILLLILGYDLYKKVRKNDPVRRKMK